MQISNCCCCAVVGQSSVYVWDISLPRGIYVKTRYIWLYIRPTLSLGEGSSLRKCRGQSSSTSEDSLKHSPFQGIYLYKGSRIPLGRDVSYLCQIYIGYSDLRRSGPRHSAFQSAPRVTLCLHHEFHILSDTDLWSLSVLSR